MEKADAAIENQLGEIVIALEAMAEVAVDERRRRMEQERIRREEEHQRYLKQRAREHDNKRWNRFRQLAVDWEESDRLRRFIALLETEAAAMQQPPAVLIERIAWARGKLDVLDPLKNGAIGVAEKIEAVGEWD